MLRKLLLSVAFFVVITVQFSCLKGKEGCDFTECEIVAPASEIQAVSNYLSANTLTATQHCSGLFYTVTSAGTGKPIEPCSDVTAKYVGQLTSGAVFDQTDLNTYPSGISFSLSQVIRGWRIGVPLINGGGSITLYIPPALGYGYRDLRDPNTGNVIIPANSILVFTVEVTAVL